MKLRGTESSVFPDKNLATERRRDVAEVLNLIYAAVAELNLQRSQKQQLKPSLDTALFGDGGSLDSLALGNFIVITEQRFEERFGFRIDLTENDPFSPATGHFRTIGSLATYISSLAQQ
jgi:acyl carrier protein